MNIYRFSTFTCIIVSVVLFFSSCSEEKKEEIVYNDSVLTEHSALSINPNTIKIDYELARPENILIFGDSIMVIFEPDAENVCKVISKDGKYMGEFGKKGKSKEELLSPVCMVSENNDIVGIYDYNTMKLQRFSLRRLLSNKNAYLSTFDFKDFLSNEGKENTVINYILGLGINRYLLFGNNKNRIIFTDKEKITNVYTEYPSTDKDEECNWAIWGYSARYGISPDRKHVVTTTYVGTLLETFDVSSNKISSSITKGFIRPKYGIAKGAKPKWITPDYEHPEGFYSLYVDDDKIYGTIGGKDCEYRNELYAFDYAGKVLGKYIFPCDIKCMTKLANYMYFLLESDDGEIIFCRKDVNAFN